MRFFLKKPAVDFLRKRIDFYNLSTAVGGPHTSAAQQLTAPYTGEAWSVPLNKAPSQRELSAQLTEGVSIESHKPLENLNYYKTLELHPSFPA